MSRPGPGKYEGCEDLELAERLHSLSLEGGCDEEVGTIDEPQGWIGRIADALLFEDDRGFFTYQLCESEQDARNQFEAIERDALRP